VPPRGMRSSDAASLHAGAIVVDGVNLSVPTRARLVRMRDAGLTAFNATLAIHENQTETMRAIASWERTLAEHADVVRPVRTAADIRRAKDDGRVGVVYGFQNGTPFEDEVGFVRLFASLGVRIVQPAYMTQNLIGAGCLEPSDSGLTAFGRDVVRELNACGVVIDLSHCGSRTTLDAVDVSSAPVVMTHANPSALVANPRNRTDEDLLAVAASGGVVGAVAFRSFLAPPSREATLDDLLDHIDYLVDLLGPDHVGVGTDFTEGRPRGFLDRAFGRHAPPGVTPRWPWHGPIGFERIDELPRLTQGLVERGHEERVVPKILGENFLRLFERVWPP
jgi:membrane dipeptidase